MFYFPNSILCVLGCEDLKLNFCQASFSQHYLILTYMLFFLVSYVLEVFQTRKKSIFNKLVWLCKSSYICNVHKMSLSAWFSILYYIEVLYPWLCSFLQWHHCKVHYLEQHLRLGYCVLQVSEPRYLILKLQHMHQQSLQVNNLSRFF